MTTGLAKQSKPGVRGQMVKLRLARRGAPHLPRMRQQDQPFKSRRGLQHGPPAMPPQRHMSAATHGTLPPTLPSLRLLPSKVFDRSDHNPE